MKEKVYVYIGRFQLLHKGHEEVLKHALTKCDRLIIQVGSSEIARDPKNPFTFEERKSVLEEITQRLAKDEWSKGHNVAINIVPLHDYVYDNNKWLKEVQENVLNITTSTDITITGCKKKGDKSTEYLNYFPQWKSDHIYEVQSNAGATISSTELREAFFVSNTAPQEFVPVETLTFLHNFVKQNPEIMDTLIKEFEFVNRYIEQMQTQLPYKNIPFLTGDSLVTCAGHILVVRRRTQPGKGLYALPGGFFDAWKDKDQVDTALRELREETKISVREKDLRSAIVKVDEFGDFNRSLRWRIITKCVHIKLDYKELPKVKGSDDADKAFWLPMSEVVKNRHMFFEDHLSIIDTFLGIV